MAGCLCADGTTYLPSLDGVVKYTFLVKPDTIVPDTAVLTVTVGGSAPAYTTGSLSCFKTEAASTQIRVNEATGTTSIMETSGSLAASDSITCSYTATVTAGAQGNGVMPAYTIDVTLTDNSNLGLTFAQQSFAAYKVHSGSTLNLAVDVKQSDQVANPPKFHQGKSSPAVVEAFQYVLRLPVLYNIALSMRWSVLIWVPIVFLQSHVWDHPSCVFGNIDQSLNVIRCRIIIVRMSLILCKQQTLSNLSF